MGHQIPKETDEVDKEVIMLGTSTQMGCVWLSRNPTLTRTCYEKIDSTKGFIIRTGSDSYI